MALETHDSLRIAGAWRILGRFLLLGSLVLSAPLVVYVDTTISGGALTEVSFTEALHNFFLFVSALCFGWGAVRYPQARGYLVLIATMMICAFIRELDFLLDHILHGFWLYPALLTLSAGLMISYRNKGTIHMPFLRHMATKEATYVFVGIIVMFFFTRTFGSGSLWREILGPRYDPAFKAILQEGLEYLCYLLIAYGSITSFMVGFGTPNDET